MKNLLLPLVLLFSSTLFAQDIRSYIPEDATFLFSWNADQIGRKVNTRQLMQQESMDLIFQEFVQGMDSLQQEEYHRLMTDPSTYGIESQQPMHFVGKRDDRGTFYAFLFPLTNPSLLEDFVTRQMTVFGDSTVIEDFGAYKLVNLGSYHIGWNNEVGIIADGQPAVPAFDFNIYDEEPTDFEWNEEEPAVEPEEIEEIEEPGEIIEEQPEEIIEEQPEEYYDEEAVEEEYDPGYWEEEESTDVVAEWAGEILCRSFGPSILSNPDYLRVSDEPADAHFWISYQQFMALTSGGLGGQFGGMSMMGAPNPNKFLKSLYDGVFMSMTLHFNQGALELKTEMLGQGRMVKVLQDAYDAKFNRKMLKYIDGRYLLGYYSVRMNVEALVDGFKDILYEAMAEVPMYGESINRMLDVVGIIIDEDALYDLIKGDIFVGMTGVRESETTVITYEYDMDFNASEVEKVVKDQYPEFIVMTSYGNEENMRKLIRLGESFNLFLDMGSYYEIPGGEGMSSYLALHNGVLIFTNDGGLIEDHLSSGVEKANRLSKIHRKNLCKHVQAMFWDVQATWEALQQTDARETDQDLVEMMEGIKDRVETVSLLTSRKVKPSIRGSLMLNLTDKESNALEQVLELVNQVILEASGLARI
ncbi:MAG: DUF4836 family protein [Lewinellaceae bacterium]|nr:DUF4836 family protein [Lewinellaceae bacterium]